ncbi:MAG: GNAT family N-acetyltransferase [Chloroflexi bacterium]|nr:MAG: GNAT family N-acetyltransferase [Chloroflexota bacterium]
MQHGFADATASVYCLRMERLTIRKASASDTDRIVELFAGDPGDEASGIAGSREKAIAFGTGMVRLPESPQGWRQTVVAEMDGLVVGIIMAGGDHKDMRVTPQLVYLALRIFGPLGIISLLRRLRARVRVQPKTPDGAYHVAEIDVDPASRNKGIGGALLENAEAEARAGGYRLMSLTTSTANPARRLYERHGFRVVETRTDTAYKRYTEIDGRYLMVKDLR